jgi:spermidine/putrescine-binding protein
MKKLALFFAFVLVTISLSACSNTPALYLLNWGEYMDMDLVAEFEEEFGVRVVLEEATSNEIMENSILKNTTAYDIAIPSDYMVDKLMAQGLLNEIDYSKLDNYEEGLFSSSVTDLYQDYDFGDYFVPYFYGTVGLMYNLDNVDEADLTGFDVLFNPDLDYSIGLYDSARDSIAAALLAQGYSVNESDSTILDATKTYMLNNVDAYVFGDDTLKVDVTAGNLDIALVYSGDYFDTLYTYEEDELDINFGFYVPNTTNIWVDGMVIPTTSKQTDLAYEFINFFLREDIATRNAEWVGYAPTVDSVFTTLYSEEGGYDYDNYDPSPEGSSRQIYEFISDEHSNALIEIFNSIKSE